MDCAKMMKFLTSEGEEQEKALNELTPEELDFILKECRASLARRNAAKKGRVCNDG